MSMSTFLASRTGIVQPPRVLPNAPRTSYGTPKPASSLKNLPSEQGPNLRSPQTKKSAMDSGYVYEGGGALPKPGWKGAIGEMDDTEA